MALSGDMSSQTTIAIPKLKEPVSSTSSGDYVVRSDQLEPIEYKANPFNRHSNKERNKACYCGSGIKFKKCHGPRKANF